MKKYMKIFFHRGVIFGGFGPIVLAVIYFIISRAGVELMLGGGDVLMGVVSTYLIAFAHGGASVFNDIEGWSRAKSIAFHFTTVYAAYTVCYLINSWIPFDIKVLLIYTAAFIAAYFAVWLTVVLCINAHAKKMNERLK